MSTHDRNRDFIITCRDQLIAHMINLAGVKLRDRGHNKSPYQIEINNAEYNCYVARFPPLFDACIKAKLDFATLVVPKNIDLNQLLLNFIFKLNNERHGVAYLSVSTSPDLWSSKIYAEIALFNSDFHIVSQSGISRYEIECGTLCVLGKKELFAELKQLNIDLDDLSVPTDE